MPRHCLLMLFIVASLGAAERINHEGRILGPEPSVVAPILFNTAAADGVVGAMQIMPRDNPWNEDISLRPVLANSDAIIARIRSDMEAANRRRLVVFKEMNYVLVPDDQPTIDIHLTDYPDESDDIKPGTSDIGLYPIPSIMPVETWPSGWPGLSNDQWQRDIHGEGGDRHSIIVMPGTGAFWETWHTLLTTGTPAWTAANGARFNVGSNALRPDGWTSGDAAGLPMFPALMRYDEGQRGVIEHALRIVVRRTRRAYVYPATHYASALTDADLPAMGQRLRLKASFVIPASWSTHERAIAVALKKYGALVADNGGFFSISICPDDRWPNDTFDHFSTAADSDILDITQFEVIQATGPSEGPRSAGAPTANAGPDQTVALASGATLAGSATGTGITTQWYAYPGAPGAVTFANAGALGTTATFSATGTYTLMLKASNTVHTPAFDAVVITVTGTVTNPVPTLNALAPNNVTPGSPGFTMTLQGSGFTANSVVRWSGQVDLAPVTWNATQITVTVPAGYLTTAGTPTVSVFNPTPGGGTSANRTFTIAADETTPTISAITATAITTTAATIQWHTDEAATSRVEYGLSNAFGSATTATSVLVTNHSVVLHGLTAGTMYHFRVRSGDASGNISFSGDRVFTTASSDDGAGGDGDGGGESCGFGLGLVGVLGLMAGLGLVGGRRLGEDRSSRIV